MSINGNALAFLFYDPLCTFLLCQIHTLRPWAAEPLPSP